MRTVGVLLLACGLAAQAQEKSMSGDWVIDFDYLGSTMYDRALIRDEAGRISGVFAGQSITGTRTGNKLVFHALSGGAHG